ncbi:MAG: endonuclease/exonuclease/phosphatase family protein [Verrucomicrobiota bacterium]
MSRTFLPMAWLAGLFLAAAVNRSSVAAESNSAAQLRVMTFNLRYASTNAPNAWSARRPVMRECLQKAVPDLIGTQEGLYPQLKDIAADLPDYAWIGTGRDGGSRGEFMAIFYRKDRFEPMEFDHFWLSDTPSVVGSTTWGNRNRRMVTWVRFLDKTAGREFYFVNTHLDHEIQLAREKAATLIRERIEALRAQIPVLLVGDFNAAAGANKAYEILTDGGFLTDTWTSAQERRNENISSFHDFRGPRAGARIDWILTRGPVDALATEILTCAENGQYPSDHFPVMTWMRWRD